MNPTLEAPCHHDRTFRVLDRLGPMLDHDRDARAEVLESHVVCSDCGVTLERFVRDQK